MKRNTISGKKMQTYSRYNFCPCYGSQRIAQNTEERKVDVFFICYLNCDFCRPVANKKYQQEPSRTSMVMKHFLFFFPQKCPIVNVRLGYKYTPQLVFNKKNFLPYNISI